MKLAFLLSGDHNASTILSNLGYAVLPDEMAKYVTGWIFSWVPSPSTA